MEVSVEAIDEEIDDRDFDKNEIVEFKGKYIKAVGRRKTAAAQVRLYEGGKGITIVNGKKLSQYFSPDALSAINQPLKVTGHARDFNFSVIVKGGGKSGQIEAIRHGISRAILLFDPATKEALKANGFLTRDPRKVERKKPGFRKARKRPQWSKR
ncbi:MAG: 30S ribosomal protein S9 [Candidatus Falkowbacteria bacterium]|nr:30S ribosomal protein S9 [Candidatus Falkowbacteria bacterium]